MKEAQSVVALSMAKHKWIKQLWIALTVWMAVCLLVNAGSFLFLQKALRIQVQGRFVPSLWNWAFSIQDPNFEWKDKVSVSSGRLRVQSLSPEYWMTGRMRVQISSQNAVIQLKGDWARMQGSEQLALHHLFTDLVLDSQGISEIRHVLAKSPSFHFQIQENQKGAPHESR